MGLSSITLLIVVKDIKLLKITNDKSERKFCATKCMGIIMKKQKKLIYLVSVIILSLMLTSGCAMIDNVFNKVREEWSGIEFVASVYDSYGNNTLKMKGSSLSINTLRESGIFLDKEGNDKTYQSSVLDVTIDGKQVLMVGDTIVFAENGLDMITDFSVDEINSEKDSPNIQWIDRSVNQFKNKIGKSRTIIISTQMGVPIGVFQGNSVYVEVPGDLPKTTRLSIDGKIMYIHRANYQIIDSSLIK